MKHLQWARRGEEAVHISQVESGLACQCNCDKCGVPLIARRGEVRIHHFAHQSSGCDGNNESLLHLKAKEVIEEHKKLNMLGLEGISSVEFDEVLVEQAVGPYRVDVVGRADGRSCYIEIVVTHYCDEEKLQYFKKRQLALLEVVLSREKVFEDIEAFEKYVLSDARRYWRSNSILEKRRQASKQALLPPQHVAYMKEVDEFLGCLSNSAGLDHDGLHYGQLIIKDLRRYGIPYSQSLCVSSPDIPKKFDQLGMVNTHGKKLLPFKGQKAGFKIIYCEEISRVSKNNVLFPQVLVCWIDGVDPDHLRDIKDDWGYKWGEYILI